jgi:peptidoglycan/xylan/chitin deacetylase (PgdA/CDA1 family)
MGRRQRLRLLTFRALRMSLAPLVSRRLLQRERVTVVVYHDPDPVRFERHLTVLQSRYAIIDLRAYIESVRNGTVGRLPRRSLIVTLDDGHRRNRDLLPVLERLGVPVTIFVCSSIVGTDRRYWFKHVDDSGPLKRMSDAARLEHLRERGFVDTDGNREALSDTEIRQMCGPLVDFQSHTLTHPILPQCDAAKARAEIAESRHALRSRYGFDIYAFAYPNGDYSRREMALVHEAGYLCAVTTKPGFNDSDTDPFQLKRIVIDDHDGIDELIVKASGVWGGLRRAAAAIA